MNKIFWKGFNTGFVITTKYGLPIIAGFILGLILGSDLHPYETCKRMHDIPEDISECVWIRENP